MKITGTSVGILAFLFGAWHLFQVQSISAEQNITSGFKGNFLAASDADMIAGAYANGELNKVTG